MQTDIVDLLGGLRPIFKIAGGGFPVRSFGSYRLEAFSLFENHQYGVGGTYILVSVAFCLIGILCGKRLATLIG